MNKNLTDIIGAVFLIVAGVCSAIFHRILAKISVEQQYKIFHVRINERHSWIAFLVLGIAFIVFGVLSLFGIIKFK